MLSTAAIRTSNFAESDFCKKCFICTETLSIAVWRSVMTVCPVVCEYRLGQGTQTSQKLWFHHDIRRRQIGVTETSLVFSTHSYGQTGDRHCFLTVSSRCIWTRTYTVFVCEGETGVIVTKVAVAPCRYRGWCVLVNVCTVYLVAACAGKVGASAVLCVNKTNINWVYTQLCLQLIIATCFGCKTHLQAEYKFL